MDAHDRSQIVIIEGKLEAIHMDSNYKALRRKVRKMERDKSSQAFVLSEQEMDEWEDYQDEIKLLQVKLDRWLQILGSSTAVSGDQIVLSLDS